MAEKLKTFFNGTFTVSDLAGNNDEFVIIANDGTTQAVVRDVIVDADVQPVYTNGGKVPVKLLNGDIAIGDNVNMTGSEIVDVNTVLKYKLPPYEAPEIELIGIAKKSAITSTTTVTTSITDTDPNALILPLEGYKLALSRAELIAKYFSATNVVEDKPSINLGGEMSSPLWFFATDSIAMYHNYDGNSITHFYTALVDENGNVGAWGVENQDTYAYKTVESETGDVWWVVNKTLYKFDSQTLVTSQVKNLASVMSGAPSTFTCSGMANGIFFLVISNSYTDRFIFYNSKTLESGEIFVSQNFGISSYPYLGVTFNPIEKRYYIFIGFNASFSIYSINEDFLAGDYLEFISSNGASLLPNGMHDSCGYIQGNSLGELFIRNSKNHLEKVFVSSEKIVSKEIYTDVTPYNRSGWLEPNISKGNSSKQIVDIGDLEINLKCKISGVEITEV